MTLIALCRQRAPLHRIALAALLAAPAAEAAEFAVNYANADTRRWSCRLCEFDRAAARAGTLAAGALTATESQMRFGRDNGIDRSGGYLDVNAGYRLATRSGLMVDFAGRNLGLDSRDAALRVRQPRRYGIRFRYRETPRNLARDGRSPFTGTDTLALPADWIPAFGTAAMRRLAQSSEPVELATERRRSEIGAWYSLASALTVKSAYYHERKRGVVDTSRDFFYHATALPQPVDYRVEGANAGLHYESRTVSMAITYAGRKFRNGADLLEWDNPYIGPVARGRSAAAPDNRARSLSFVSRLRMGSRTRLNATLVRSEAKQDAPFLAYSSNEAIDLPPIAEPGLDGNRELLSAAVNLISRPTPRLRVNVSHVVTERRDRRADMMLTPVLGDLFATAAVTAPGYDYKRASTRVRLRYRLPGRFRLAAGFSHLDNRRSGLEIAGNDRLRGWLELTGEIGTGWRFRLKHDRADRDAAEFHANTRNNPLTRRFYQAERRDSEWSGGIRFDSAASGLSIGFDANRRELDYPESPLGLQRDLSAGWALDAAFAPAPAVSISGFYGVQSRKSRTAGSAGFPDRGWLYDIDDKVTTAGARLVARGFPHPALELSANYAHSDGVGDYETALGAMRSSFPALISRHRSLDLRLRYAWRPRASLVLRYYFERYRGADWSIDGLGPDAIRNVLTLGRSSPRYGNHLIALSVETTL